MDEFWVFNRTFVSLYITVTRKLCVKNTFSQNSWPNMGVLDFLSNVGEIVIILETG